MKDLVIVESPSKAKTIEKYLGKEYKVLSSKGHIRDLAVKGKGGLGVDVDHDFAPVYTVSKEKKELVKQLKSEAKKAHVVYLATDMDREGEAISWHLAEELGLDLDKENRIVFNEITKNAILRAVEEPRKIDMDLVRSQETRRILDRIIGFRLSSLLKKKIRSKSAGRVQSVALKIICDREKEIEKFVPEEYWSIEANFKKDKIDFKANLTQYKNKKVSLKTEEEAAAVVAQSVNPFLVSKVRENKKKRNPYLPFTTSTLQQEASSKLNFGAKRTMSIAQSLYEGVDIGQDTQGLITYMRTDSTRLSKEFVESAYALIKQNYGSQYVGSYRVKNDDNAQDAHEAIRPTNLDNQPEKIKKYLSADQYKLYCLIYYRALASLMKAAETKALSIDLQSGDAVFTATGSTLIFDGFLAAYKEYDSSKDVLLPVLQEEEKINSNSVVPSQHFTEAPSRYTEAKLIKALEEEGIGRPSTYATILDTIVQRGYVELKKNSAGAKTKYFYPTEQGRLTDDKLAEFFSDIINIKYTAAMEKELDAIAENKLDYKTSLHTFYDRFQPLYEQAEEKMPKKELEKTGDTCPLCGGDLVIRVGRYGKFISCSNYPTCKYTAKLVSPDKEPPEKTGIICPECGGELLKRKNRFGTYFLGCSNFPKCKHLENIDGQEKPKHFYRRKKKNA